METNTMTQGEQCFHHWERTGEFTIPDGVDAVIRSRRLSSSDDSRRVTYVLFPDGSEVAISIYRLNGQNTVRMSWAYDPDEEWPRVVLGEPTSPINDGRLK